MVQLDIQLVECVVFRLPAVDAGMADVEAGEMDLWDGKCGSNAKMLEKPNARYKRIAMPSEPRA